MTVQDEPKKPSLSPVVLITLVAAILSFVAASGAILISWVALQRAGENPGPAQAAAPQNTTQPQSVKTSTTPNVKLSATTPPELNERTAYSVKYTKQSLTLTADCYSSMYADVDEPRGNVSSNGADLTFSGGCSASDPAAFSIGSGVDAAITDNPASTPQECTDKIRTAPVGRADIPVRQGLAFCLTTSYESARSRGDNWRVILVVITGVSNLQTVTIEASAWNIPQ